jgi:ABC-type dipeptide/oligopeptide/nickel transport system permease component
MTRYILGRLLQALLAVLVISSLAFLITRLVPGDPAKAILGVRARADSLAALRQVLGIDKPLLSQYLHFIGGVGRFDFGESFAFRGESVTGLLLPRLWPSLWLVVYSCVLAVLMAIPLGVLAAVRRNRTADHLIRLGSTLGYATPAFLTGLVLILIFSVKLGLTPVSGYGEGVFEIWRSLTLPAITIALALAPFLLRTLRAGLLDTLGADFVEAAHARGLSARRVLFKHALRNSMLPALTVLGWSFGAMLSATVLVENVFAIPGLGTLLVSAVGNRDFPMVQALVVVLASAVVLSNLVTDLLYFVVDPRIER